MTFSSDVGGNKNSQSVLVTPVPSSPPESDLVQATPVLPDAAVDLFEFSSGQAEFEAHVEVEATAS